MNIYDIENHFYQHCDPSRLGKLIAHYQLYEMSLGVPGDFIEVGVFKGSSFCRFRKFGKLLHPDHARRFLGFDVFGKFPDSDWSEDAKELEAWVSDAGEMSIDRDELLGFLTEQGLASNVELVKGDIRETLPDYFKSNRGLSIAIANIDVDLYGPTKTAIETIFPRVPKGGIIILDDYAGGFPGANRAIEEFLEANKRPETIQKFDFTDTPCFLVKEDYNRHTASHQP